MSAPRFPVMLRKMWSGGEVQRWLDSNWVEPDAKDVTGWRMVGGVRVFTIESSVSGHRRDFVAFEDYQAAHPAIEPALAKCTCHECIRVKAQMQSEIDRLRGEVATAAGEAKDAERYGLVRRSQHWDVVNGIGETLRAEALDVSVDAVIAAKAEVPNG